MSEEFLALHPLIDAIGWTLIHFVWQGALFGLLFAALMKTMAASSASARYAMAVGILMLLGIAPIATFSLLAMGYTAPATLLVTPVAAYGWWIDVESSLRGLLPWGVLAWLAGVMGLSGRLALDWMAVQRLASYATKPLSPDLDKLAMKVRQAYRVASKVRVLESAIVNVPLAVGWLKPVILIPPSALMGLTPRQLELILAHEFAHIRRYDHLVNLYQVILETLLFYHPVVRWVSNSVRVERENCCDDLVVANTGDSVAYARALTELEGLRNVSPQLAIAATDGQLLHRVNRLVVKRHPQRGSAAWAASLLLVLINLSVLTGTHMALDGGADEPGELPAAALPVVEVPTLATGPVQDTATPVSTAASMTQAPEPMPRASAPEPKHIVTAALVEPKESPPVPKTGKSTKPAFTVPSVVDAAPEEASQPEVIEEELVAVPATARPVTESDSTKVSGNAPQAGEETRTDTLRTDRAGPLSLDDVLSELLQNETAPISDVPSPEYTGGEFVSGKPPIFPRKARRALEGGWVVARFTVDLSGRVEDVNILESRPAGIFDKSVKKAVAKWRFKPYELEGAAVARTVTQAFRFELGPGQVADASDTCQAVTGSRLCRPSGQSIKIIYFARR